MTEGMKQTPFKATALIKLACTTRIRTLTSRVTGLMSADVNRCFLELDKAAPDHVSSKS